MATATQEAWLKTMATPAQLSQSKWGIPASVTLAQCILESAWGQSQLARRCNNYFGIKAGAGQDYEEFNTREVVTGRSVVELAQFAKYPSAIESFNAHARLLACYSRYDPAMRYKLDPLHFALELHLCGYSTDPAYGARLINLIHAYHLTEYDVTPPDRPASVQEAA